MSVEVIVKDPTDHPSCPHGPTLLLSRHVKGEKRNFFACAACRERKDCNFFLWEDEKHTYKKNIWKEEQRKYSSGVNHRKKFVVLNEIRSLPRQQRMFCCSCDKLLKSSEKHKHKGHDILENITDNQLEHPSEILPALEQNKKEAQYLFSNGSVAAIFNIFKNLEVRNVICIGTPRIHEHIQSNCQDMSSILLDFDKRFHNFFGPLQFCWYNLFNHHFFLPDAKMVFDDYLKSCSNLAIIMDPPFGARIEPISLTLETITNSLKKYHGTKNNLSVFLVLPYFMEPQVLNWLPDMRMSDYKVEYDNHVKFQSGPKGRKHGSPVRIFTNVNLGLVKLPKDGYRYCESCNKWVAIENSHCPICDACTSKNGSTYKHCSSCERCVKPTWQHCDKCGRCAVIGHTCQELEFSKTCFHCKKGGHKKSQCPSLSNSGKKRKTKRSERAIKGRKKQKVI
nr:unnamed protein product [Callosobruchus chinensis]